MDLGVCIELNQTLTIWCKIIRFACMWYTWQSGENRPPLIWVCSQILSCSKWGHTYFVDFPQITGYLAHTSGQHTYNCLTFLSRKAQITNACYYILSSTWAFGNPNASRQKYMTNMFAMSHHDGHIFFSGKAPNLKTLYSSLCHTKPYSLCCLATE